MRHWQLLGCLAVLLWASFAALAQPAALQGLKLVDHRGKAVTPASLQSRALLLNFIFAGCSTTCPTQLHELAELQATLPVATRQQVGFLSVTVDPLSDTPQALAAYARRMDADRPGWRFVSGAPAQVYTLIDRMQALDTRKPAAQRQAADHRTSIYLFDAQGALLQRYAGVPLDRARLAREINQAAAKAATAPLASKP